MSCLCSPPLPMPFPASCHQLPACSSMKAQRQEEAAPNVCLTGAKFLISDADGITLQDCVSWFLVIWEHPAFGECRGTGQAQSWVSTLSCWAMGLWQCPKSRVDWTCPGRRASAFSPLPHLALKMSFGAPEDSAGNARGLPLKTLLWVSLLSPLTQRGTSSGSSFI